MAEPERPLRVDVKERPRLSDAAMESIFPTQAASRKAQRDTLPRLPGHQATAMGSAAAAKTRASQRDFEDSLQARAAEKIDKRDRVEGPLSTNEGQVGAATLAAGAAVTPFLGPLSIPAAMATVGLVGGGTELITRLVQGESFEDAAPKAAVTTGFFAAGEGLGPLAAKGFGLAFRGVRGAVRNGRQAVRNLRGKDPLPDTPRIESTSAPFAKDFLEPEAIEVFDTITGLGGNPQPGQLVQHNLIDSVQKILNKSLSASQGQRVVKETNQKLLVNAIQNVVDQFPKLGRREVGEMIQGLVTGRLAQVKGVAQGYYREADRLLGKTKQVSKEIIEDIPSIGLDGTPILDSRGRPVIRSVTKTITETVPEHGVNTVALKKLAQKELNLLESGQRNNPGLEKNLRAILDKPDTITYSSAQQIRTELFETSQQLTRGPGDVAKANKRAATALTTPLTRAMNDAAKSAGPEAKAMIDNANRLWREEIRGELTQKFITKLVNNQADDVLDAIVASGRAGDIRMIRDIVMKESPEAWDAIQGSFLNRLVYAHGERRLIGNGTKVVAINGKGLIDDLTRMAKEDGSVLRELFPGTGSKGNNALGNFKRYIQALESTQRPISGEATGAMFIQLGQAAAIGTGLGSLSLWISGNATGSVVAGGLALGAAYVLLPHQLGRAFRNPEIVRWLTIGAKHSPGTVPAIKASLAVLGLMIKHHIFSPEDEERAAEQVQSLSESLGLK